MSRGGTGLLPNGQSCGGVAEGLLGQPRPFGGGHPGRLPLPAKVGLGGRGVGSLCRPPPPLPAVAAR
jgi:hypothetical protein